MDPLTEVIINSECEQSKQYFFRKCSVKKCRYPTYEITFPGVFKKKERERYAIYITLEYPDPNLTDNYFTVGEYINLISILFGVSSGEYDKRSYINGVNDKLKDMERRFKCSDKVSKLFDDKGIIKKVRKTKIWYEKCCTDKSQKRICKILDVNIDDNLCMGLQIVFMDKTFGCFMVSDFEE